MSSLRLHAWWGLLRLNLLTMLFISQTTRRFFPWALLLVGSLGIFIWIQSIDTFPDPDSFYHIEMSRQIAAQGVMTTFPWLQVSTLRDAYIDQHFLYHVFLIPFTHFFDPIQGTKFAHVLLNTGFIMLAYGLLRRERVPGAFWFAVLLLASSPFMFRLNLVKAPVVSLLFLVGGLYLLFRYRYVPLFFLAAGYVWAYGGFSILIMASGFYAFVSLVLDAFRLGGRLAWPNILRASKELRMLGVVLAGTTVGIFINPHFPVNLQFYWQQFVQIGVVNYQKVIAVGGEWYPYQWLNLLTSTALITVLVLSSLVLGAAFWRRLGRKQLTLALLFIVFLVFTLKSKRYVEYYVPVAVIFSAMMFRAVAGDHWKQEWLPLLRRWTRQYLIVTIIVSLYLVIGSVAIMTKDVKRLHQDYLSGISTERFAGVGAWMRDHITTGAIVFHSSWDEFPILFYRSPQAYYIAGLDPTFSYTYNVDLWNSIVDITTGKQKEGIYQTIRDTFHAQYVFVESNHAAFNSAVKRTDGFRQVYRDGEAIIYEVVSE
ncbi:MAG: hypothetical protein HZC01_02350 [Candidatus Kerfeldbacteria bacterium]|nr:hypothetical protein [Candidatus Kerfeldbacteria bacterium]